MMAREGRTQARRLLALCRIGLDPARDPATYAVGLIAGLRVGIDHPEAARSMLHAGEQFAVLSRGVTEEQAEVEQRGLAADLAIAWSLMDRMSLGAEEDHT